MVSDTLSTLNWLVEAGADEAAAEEPVNRLAAKAPVQPLPAAVARPAPSSSPARAPAAIVGDAIGTAIPLLCTSLFFLPRHMCRQLGVPLRTFLVEAYLYPTIFCLPMIFVLVLMQRSFYAHRYPQLVLNLLVGTATYGACVLWFVLTREPIGIQLKTRMSRYFGQTGESES